MFKVVLLGPPEAGKTQLVSALLGDYHPVKYSTPFSTKAKLAVTRYVMKNSVRWELLTKDVFQQCLFRSANEKAVEEEAQSSHENEPEALLERASPTGPSQVSEVPPSHSGKILNVQPEEYPRQIVGFGSHSIPKPCQASEEHSMDFDSKDIPKPSDNIKADFAKLLRDVNDQCPVYDEEQTLQVRYVHLIDNGGQPAFFDAHPVVATSRATYLLVYNMQEGLDAKPQYTYRKRGCDKNKYQPPPIPNDHYRNLDLLQASLQTISNLKEKFCLMERKVLDDSQLHAPSVQPTGSYILVVGTRFDVEVPVREGAATAVTDWEEKLSTEHSDLERACKCVCSAWENVQKCKMRGELRCLFPVDSLNKDCQGVQAVREIITSSDFGLKLRISIKWFHCHLLFWHAKEERKVSGEKMYPQFEVLKFSKLLDLCKEHELVSDEKDLLAMIRAFHVLGLFFFPALDQEEEEGWKPDDKPVFTNPDFLYEELTKILEIAFEQEFPGGPGTGEDTKLFSQLKDYGELTSTIMGRLGIPDKLDAIPELNFHEYILDQLSTWGLAAKLPASISQGSGEDGTTNDPVYFVPSVLQPFHKLEDNNYPCVSALDCNSALCISLTVYDNDTCTYYIPNGAFTHFVVNLLQPGNAYQRRKPCHGVQRCYSDSVDLVRHANSSPQQLKYGYFLTVATCKLESITVVITPCNPDNKWAHDYYQIIWNELRVAMAKACEQMFHMKGSHEITVATKCCCCESCDSHPHLAKLRIAEEDMECLFHSNQQNLQEFLLEVVKSSKGELVYMHMYVRMCYVLSMWYISIKLCVIGGD